MEASKGTLRPLTAGARMRGAVLGAGRTSGRESSRLLAPKWVGAGLLASSLTGKLVGERREYLLASWRCRLGTPPGCLLFGHPGSWVCRKCPPPRGLWTPPDPPSSGFHFRCPVGLPCPPQGRSAGSSGGPGAGALLRRPPPFRAPAVKSSELLFPGAALGLGSLQPTWVFVLLLS